MSEVAKTFLGLYKKKKNDTNPVCSNNRSHRHRFLSCHEAWEAKAGNEHGTLPRKTSQEGGFFLIHSSSLQPQHVIWHLAAAVQCLPAWSHGMCTACPFFCDSSSQGSAALVYGTMLLQCIILT